MQQASGTEGTVVPKVSEGGGLNTIFMRFVLLVDMSFEPALSPSVRLLGIGIPNAGDHHCTL